jgi:hypothetical protein
MPRLRKPEAITFNDDELYALTRVTLGYLPKKGGRWRPNRRELGLLKDAYNKVSIELYARAEEEQRINNELHRIAEEYIEPKYE